MKETPLDTGLTRHGRELSDIHFKGILGAKKIKHDNAKIFLERTRNLIFIMAGLVMYRVVVAFLFNGSVPNEIVIERVLLACILVIAGFWFKKNPMGAMLLSLLPIGLLIFPYFFIDRPFPLTRILINLFIFCSILFGMYKYLEMDRLKKELLAAFHHGDPEAILFEDIRK